MPYFDTFMAINKPPSEQIKDHFQEMVNSTFEVASTYNDDIYQEREFGSLEFERIEARITSLIDPKSGEKIEDDYKKILFKDLSYTPELGSRYKFSDNIWIVWSVGNIKSTTSTAYLRRCNITVGIQDKYGKVHQEPCFIETKPNRISMLEYDAISIPSNRFLLYCQLNRWTENLSVNSRMLFGDNAFKIVEQQNINRTKTLDRASVRLLRFYVDYNNLNEYDNIELNVADYKIPNYEIICQDDIIGLIGDTSILTAKVTLDKKEAQEQVYWYSQDKEVVEVDKLTGEYTLVGNGITTIKCALANNEDYYVNINVQVLEESIEVYENKITPDTNLILLNQEQKFTVFESLNGQRTDTLFSVQAEGMPTSYYSIRTEGNDFYITNKKINKKSLLKIVCTNQRDLSTIVLEIELGGLF